MINLDEYEKIEIPWDELKIGDMFEDGSKVINIEDWEYRPCYELRTNDNSIIVSDEHLIKCDIYESRKQRCKNTWFTAEEIKNIFDQKYRIILSGSNKRLKSISLYDGGWPQKVRCISTNTGEYQISDFINHNTTTLVACINDFTKKGEVLDNKMIITLEDPIEYEFTNTESVRFMQKELGQDFKSFASGIKQALREHPNMINVGECRDKEVIVAAIEACRTGHGVVTSFHASDVPGTISRLSFYLDDKDMIYDLIINLNLIISQKLEPSNDRYIIRTQYMLFNDDITKRILEILDSDKNISVEIEKMFHDQKLIDQGLVKDWS